jgi:putative membrane protein insertion efficiency factor
VDALATAALAALGFQVARAADPFGWAPWPRRALIALPFALVGPLGVGIERGRKGPPSLAVALAASGGAALGAFFALLHAEGLSLARASALDLGDVLFAIAPPLLLGPFLAKGGARFARADEVWREAARSGPPLATPALATRIARFHVPLAARVLLAPLVLATLPLAVAGLVLIRCYQLTLSRLVPPACRFEPSCSRYGFEAFWRHGLVKGALLTAYRVGRCQPFCTGGHDPVPEANG